MECLTTTLSQLSKAAWIPVVAKRRKKLISQLCAAPDYPIHVQKSDSDLDSHSCMISDYDLGATEMIPVSVYYREIDGTPGHKSHGLGLPWQLELKIVINLVWVHAM